MATATNGHESGTEDPFMAVIDELYVISENERNQTA